MATQELKNTILDHALAIGGRTGWEQLNLHTVAEAAGLTLADVYACFPQKDDIVEAWFSRADLALLRRSPDPHWAALPAKARLGEVIWCWLSALAPYRKLSGEMLLYKLEPGHLHLQLGGLLRISRTVQWFREAAQLQAVQGARIVQESVLTGIFVATFLYWLNDDSAQQRSTRRFLQRQLNSADRLRLLQ